MTGVPDAPQARPDWLVHDVKLPDAVVERRRADAAETKLAAVVALVEQTPDQQWFHSTGPGSIDTDRLRAALGMPPVVRPLCACEKCERNGTGAFAGTPGGDET